MRPCTILCHSLAAGLLAVVASSCGPIGNADPLMTAAHTSSGPMMVSDPERMQDQRFHAANQARTEECDEASSFRGSVGMSTAAEW